MNSLIFFSDELIGQTEARVCGDRMAYIQEWHNVHEGVEVSAAVWGARRGKAKVESVSMSEIVFRLTLTDEPMSKHPVSLVVAIPRPQTVKKVIQSAHAYGISSLHFVRAHNTVRSYGDSKTLTPESIKAEVLKSMEQTGDSLPLEVSVHRNWRDFSDAVIEGICREFTDRYFADTRSSTPMPSQRARSLAIAIGPEAGWTDKERDTFKDRGFMPVSLGPRMLRVEHAAGLMVSKALISLGI